MIIFSLFVYNIALPALIYFLTLYLLGFLSIPNKKNYNDNTSGVLVLLYLMSILRNEKAAYVFFDNEEKGLIGSFSFLSFLNKKNLKPRRKKFIVLDCVGRGELIRFTYFKDNKLPRELHKVADNGRAEYRFEVKKVVYWKCPIMSFYASQSRRRFCLRRKGKETSDKKHSQRQRQIF